MDRKVLRRREMRLFKHKGWMVVSTISKWQEVVFDAFSCFEPVIIVIIRLCLEPNIEITLGNNLAVFTRSAITQPIVNDLDEICSNLSTLLGAGPGTFCAVTTVWEAGKVFLSPISRRTNFTFEHNNVDWCCHVNFQNRI